MIFLALTKEGLKNALELAEKNNDSVWCTSDAVTEREFNKMKQPNLTRFNYSFSAVDQDAINDAIETIQEHHPGESVWVEF